VGAAMQHSCDDGVDERIGHRVTKERSTEGISQRALIGTYSWLTKQVMKSLLLGSILLQSVLIVLCEGQIILDGSLGPRGPLPGPDYRIGAELGQIHGGNVFHSFGEFNVPNGGSATFTGPNSIANILGRVTGGQPSVIDGLLRSEILGANLYLLNPSGVLFGQNATLDVSGSFHVSTADFLRFADGVQFFTHLGEASVLTVAAPAAFGFLGTNPAPITIQGSTLLVPEGKALSVVGGNITVVGGPHTADFVPTLGAEGGRIYLASVASPGEVGFSPLSSAPELQVDSFAHLGRLELSQGTLVDASGDDGGAILLRSGRLLVDRSQIFADNLGSMDAMGVGVDLRVAAEAVIRNGSLITTDRFGAGRARSMQLTARSLTVDASGIGARGEGSGTGGNILVQGGALALTGGGQIVADTFSIGSGGDITIGATERISIVGRGPSGPSGLFSNTFGSGDAGRITISTPLLTMDGSFIQAGVAPNSRGNAGNIEVQVRQLTLTGGGEISTSTFGVGRGGVVSVTASESVSIAGRDTDGVPSGLFSSTSGTGAGGSIRVQARALQLQDEGTISARSTGTGNAGSIQLQVGDTFLSENGRVSTATAGAGGGTIVLSAGQLIHLLDSAITTSVPGGGGDAGNISLVAPSVVLDGSQIIANAFEGMGGNIRIGADVFLADPASRVSASSTLGVQGIVDIQAPVTSLSGALAPLPQAFVDVATLLPVRCEVRLSGSKASSLVLGGREGLPPRP
jgi:filamentous hemagglutinin family protein